MDLVDAKCLKALKKAHMDQAAVALATEAQKMGAPIAKFTMHFLEEDEESTGLYMAELTVTVRRVDSSDA
jgi:hypothetical protein